MSIPMIQHVGGTHASMLGGLIDAASLLWRIGLRGHDVGARAAKLAHAWEPNIDDGLCGLGDLHTMLAVALRAFMRGDGMRAIPLLAILRPKVHRLSGGHAQSNVLHLTLIAAVEAIRLPGQSGRHYSMVPQRAPKRSRYGNEHRQGAPA